jgi:hypothetical protein
MNRKTGSVIYIAVSLLLMLLTVSTVSLTSPDTANADIHYKDIVAPQLDLAAKKVGACGLMTGFPDETFKPSKGVTEGDFEEILDRLAAVCVVDKKYQFTTEDPSQTITRARAVVAIVKSLTDPLAVDLIEDTNAYLSGYEDADKIPQWARKQIAAAVDNGYISATGVFRPMDALSRGELAIILEKCLPTSESQTPVVDAAPEAEAFTGLVIDAQGKPFKRSMSPVIESEDGRQVYPDKRFLPTIQYIEDHGIASFVNDISKSTRAGNQPLTIKATAVKGYASQIAVVSNEDADRILSAANRSDFIRTWKVTFLVDKGN